MVYSEQNAVYSPIPEEQNVVYSPIPEEQNVVYSPIPEDAEMVNQNTGISAIIAIEPIKPDGSS